MASDDPAKIRLKMIRGSYLHLFKPKGFGKKNEGDPKFQATAIIDPETTAGKRNLDLIEDTIELVGKEKWGKDWPSVKKKLEKADRICLKEGDDDNDDTRGMWVLASSNAKKPLALDENGDDVNESDDVIYSGCYGDMIVRIWAQDNDYGQRINASLEGFKFREDGEPFASVSRTTADDFNDDDDDDRPSRGKSRGRDKDEDDEPRGRGRGRSKDDDDEPPARGRGRGRSREDDDEPPARDRGRGRSRDDDDEPPARDRGRGRSRDDDDEPPARGRGRSRDDDDEPPARDRGRSRSRDDDDEPPRRGSGGKSEGRRRARDEDYDY